MQIYASDYGVGAVLSQLHALGNEKVITYASKAHSPHEQKYSTTEKESFAVVFGTAHFHVYLLGRHFQLITGHSALRWLYTVEAKGRLARWIIWIYRSLIFQSSTVLAGFIIIPMLSRALYKLILKNTPRTLRIRSNQHLSPQYVLNCLGHTEIVKLESSKPLIIDQDHGAVPRPSQEAGKVNTITLNPIINHRDSQCNDPHLASLIYMKTRQLPKPNFKQIKDPALKIWRRHYDQYFTRRSLGMTRTEEPVRKRVYWPGIGKTITKHIQLCRVCNHKNSPLNSNPAPLGHITVSHPFTFWAMDYMGPLPETSSTNKHILVIVDHFTKRCEAFTTSTVAPILVSRIFSRFGPPAILHSDQGQILKAPDCTKYVILRALRKREL